MGVYYPEPVELLANSRARTILCLTYDRVVAIFPGRFDGCGSGSFRDCFPECTELEEADVLELREAPMEDLDSVGITAGDLSEENCDHFSEEQWQRFMGLHTTVLALSTCVSEAAVPVTANPRWQVPAQLLACHNAVSSAAIQAAALAACSVDVALPDFGVLHEQDILEARHALQPQLQPFRHEMLRLAPLVRQGLAGSSSLEDVVREARYVVETRVVPSLGDLQRRAALERGAFWARLFVKGANVTTRFALNYITKGPLLAAYEACAGAKDALLDVIRHRKSNSHLAEQSGLGYLLSVEDWESLRKAVPRR